MWSTSFQTIRLPSPMISRDMATISSTSPGGGADLCTTWISTVSWSVCRNWNSSTHGRWNMGTVKYPP